MSAPQFTTTGEAPRIVRFEAFAFHDGAGRIHHMHHSIVLEGAEPRPAEQVLKEGRDHALALGNDVSHLRVLHVTEAFNPGVQHRVDVKRGVLVELAPPKPELRGRRATAKSSRKPSRKKPPKRSPKRPAKKSSKKGRRRR